MNEKRGVSVYKFELNTLNCTTGVNVIGLIATDASDFA